MKAGKNVPKLTDLCRESRPEDGLSPLEWKRSQASHHHHAKPNHRALQYAKAAGRAIELALSAECCEEPLDALSFHSVTLGSGGAVLHVTLTVEEATEEKLLALQPLVQAMAGRLRSVVADAIRRSRTPEVRIHLAPQDWAAS